MLLCYTIRSLELSNPVQYFALKQSLKIVNSQYEVLPSINTIMNKIGENLELLSSEIELISKQFLDVSFHYQWSWSCRTVAW